MKELREQFRAVYKGMSYSCSPQAFMRNVRMLQRKYGLNRSQAMAAAYAVLMWACERVAHSARAEMGGEEKRESCAVAGRFLTDDERKMSEVLHDVLKEEEEKDMDSELRRIREIDAALGKPLSEQRPQVTEILKSVEDDLRKGILVGIARVMRDMGYERWPRDPEGQEKIREVIDAVARELLRMGRRFTSLLRRELNVLRRLGPERYERVVRRWLVGKPSEVEEPEESKKEDALSGEDESGEEPCPGGRIRSKGMGKGLGYGGKRGPIGVPVGMKEQKVLDKVDAHWWDTADLDDRISALVDLAGMDRREAEVWSERRWDRLPGIVRASLERGMPLEPGESNS